MKKCTIQSKKCIICSVEFIKNINTSKKEWETRKFCAKKCYYIHKSQQMKGKTPKNIAMIAGRLKGKGVFNTCKGCGAKFQSRPELRHVKTKYCTRECWLTNRVREFKERPYMQGEKHRNWKGGINTARSKITNSISYKKWRYDVLKRDDHTCINCGSKKNLLVDHIKPFSLFPELRFDVNNGRVLCKSCDKFISYSFFRDNNPNQKIPRDHAPIIKNKYKSGMKVTEIAKEYGVTIYPIYRILKKQDGVENA